MESAFVRSYMGVYSKGDSYLLDCIENPVTNLLDFSATASVDASQDWRSLVYKTVIYVVNPAVANTNANVVFRYNMQPYC